MEGASLKRNSLIAVVVLALVAGGVYFFQSRRGAGPDEGSSVVASVKQGTDNTAAAAPAPPQGETRRAPPVEVAAARGAEAVTQLLSVGTLASDESVAIAAEVPGRISEIGFREGQPVEAGAVLVKLDSALARAEGYGKYG